jgi:hypothetical protein
METAFLLFHLLPAFTFVAYGTYAILEVFFPSLRDRDFGYWEVDGDNGSSIQIRGWKKVLRPPRVIAHGYFSENTACAVSLIVGIVMIVIGLFADSPLSRSTGIYPRFFQQLRPLNLRHRYCNILANMSLDESPELSHLFGF